MKEKTTRRRSASRVAWEVAGEVGASGDSGLGAGVLRKKSIQRCAIFFFADHNRSPNLNAYVERFVLSIKSECLERMIFFSEQSLRRAVAEFILHYHGERNHQGLGNALLEAEECVGGPHGKVREHELHIISGKVARDHVPVFLSYRPHQDLSTIVQWMS